MANSTSITVTPLTANGSTADPAANGLDTGTAAVTLKTSALAKTDRVIFRVVNTAVPNLTVTVNAGTDPPDFQAGKGGFTSGNIATSGVLWLGPFTSAQFSQSDQTLSVTFTPASGTIACSVQCFQLPLA
jgi:hypothetical protein